MRTSVAIQQPNFLLRLSTLAKIASADVWVSLDNVQFCQRDYQHRAALAAVDAPERRTWLSLPVHRPDGRATRLDHVRLVDPERTGRRIDALLAAYYRTSPHYPVIADISAALRGVLATTDSLVDVAEESTRLLLDLLGWSATITRSSEHTARSDRTGRLLDLTAAVSGTRYLCGSAGASYLDRAQFFSAGITVRQVEPPPEPHGIRAIWSCAHRVSTMWALARLGPGGLRGEVARFVDHQHVDCPQ
ncbi:WbqC family protein [Allokutzneria multivorans]|uniref:WbqC family protein n=1 Tax=Allokutzneria multivorans TaxID=1142134 RepID=A0ABP7TSJ4_9PSEU